MAHADATSSRVIDYFFVAGTGPTLRPISDPNDTPATPAAYPNGAGGGAADTPHPPSKRKTYMDRLYQGEVLARFPPIDHASAPFPDGITMFTIPDSIRLTQSPSELPILYYFAATQGNGSRLYGACLKFSEALPASTVERLEEADRIAAESNDTQSPSPTTSPSTMQQHDDNSPTRKKRSRSTTPTHIMQMPTVDSPVSPVASGSTSPPRPQRVGITIDSFATIHSMHSPSTQLRPNPASTSSNTVSPPPFAASPGVSVAPTATPTPTTAAKATLRPVYAPKCLCILSLHPFLEQYRVFLTELYRMSLTPSPLPLERLISNFVLEILLPPAGELKYEYTLANQVLEFERNPPNNPVRYMHSTASNRASRILTLFELLDLDNILFIFESILLEKRILFLSTRLSLLAMVGEIFLHLMYPFVWSHVYIPLLPRALLEFLYAPMPFIIGMHHSYVTGHLHGEMMVDLVVVDIDQNKVHLPNSFTGASPPLSPSSLISPDSLMQHIAIPSKERKKLKQKLKPFQALYSRGATYAGAAASSSSSSKSPPPPPHQAYQQRVLNELDLAFPNAAHPDELDAIEQYAALLSELAQQEHTISLAFFRCFVSMFKDYSDFLIYPTDSCPTPDPPFEVSAFLKKHGGDDESKRFYAAFMQTQAWQRFCEERIYLPPPPYTCAKDLEIAQGIQFFDESILAKRNRNRFTMSKKHPTPFLDDTKYVVKETRRIPGPETCGLPPPVEVHASSPTGVACTRTRPFMYVYTSFPEKFDEALFYGERIRPTHVQANAHTTNTDLTHPASTSTCTQPDSPHPNGLPPKPIERRRSLGGLTSIHERTGSNNNGVATPETIPHVIEAIWFILVAGTAGVWRNIDLLTLGIEVLTARVEHVIAARLAFGPNWSTAVPPLPLPPSEDTFLRVLRSCGSCGVPDRATDIFQNLMLRLEEYAPLQDRASAQSAAMYTLLLGIHAMNNDHRGLEGLNKLKRPTNANGTSSSSPTTPPKQINASQTQPQLQSQSQPAPLVALFSSTVPPSSSTAAPSSLAVGMASSVSVGPSTPNSLVLDHTHAVHNDGPSTYEAQQAEIRQLMQATIQIIQTCTLCKANISDSAIRSGWSSKDTDATTCCHACQGRFVARLTVRNDEDNQTNERLPIEFLVRPDQYQQSHTRTHERTRTNSLQAKQQTTSQAQPASLHDDDGDAGSTTPAVGSSDASATSAVTAHQPTMTTTTTVDDDADADDDADEFHFTSDSDGEHTTEAAPITEPNHS